MHWSANVPTLVRDFIGFLRKRGRSREDAEDLIQEAFLKLEQYCQRGNRVECAEAFLRRTVMNLAVSEHRHEYRYLNGKTGLDHELCDPAPTPEEVFSAEQRLKQMQAALDRLGQRTREVYFMHRLGGFSYSDIAKRFNCSVSLIEKQIASAATAITYERCHGKLREK